MAGGSVRLSSKGQHRSSNGQNQKSLPCMISQLEGRIAFRLAQLEKRLMESLRGVAEGDGLASELTRVADSTYSANNLVKRAAPSKFSHDSKDSASIILPLTQHSEVLDAVDLFVSGPMLEVSAVNVASPNSAHFDANFLRRMSRLQRGLDSHSEFLTGPESNASSQFANSDAPGKTISFQMNVSSESSDCAVAHDALGTADATTDVKEVEGESARDELRKASKITNANKSNSSTFENILAFLNTGKVDTTTNVDEIKTWNRAMEGDGSQFVSNIAIVQFSRSLLQLAMFDHFIAFVIMMSAIAIGVQGDHSVRYPHEPMPSAYVIIDTATTVIFAIELMLRMIAEGRYFVSCGNRHMQWNLLDTFLVISSLFDELAKVVFAGVVDIGVVRIVRFCRMVRVIRIIRVMRFFQDLRVMVYGILISMKSLLWALLLLVMIAFMFAAFILEFVASELSSASPLDDVAKRERIHALNVHFGSLITAIFSLFKAITGGVDWGEQAQPLADIHPLLGVAFSCYVAFAVLCVLNIVTGIFVDNSSKLSMKDEETLILESAENKARWIEDIQELFTEIGGSEGRLNRAQFIRGISDLRVQAKMKKFGLDVEPEALLGFFDVLDFEKVGALTVEEFTLGIRMVHGNAKSIDIARLLYDNMSIKKELSFLRVLLTDVDTAR